MVEKLNKFSTLGIAGGYLLGAAFFGVTATAQPGDGYNCGVYGQDNPAWNESCTPPFDPLGDEDGDGIPNGIECGNDRGVACLDTDQDGLFDYQDFDSDEDGLSDAEERGNSCASLSSCVPLDLNGNGVPDYREVNAGSQTPVITPDEMQDDEPVSIPERLLRTGGSPVVTVSATAGLLVAVCLGGVAIHNFKKSK